MQPTKDHRSGQDGKSDPIPLHFVCPDDHVWPELSENRTLPLPGDILSFRTGGFLNNWVLRTYHAFAAAGREVSLSASLRSDAINIVSVREFGRRQRLSSDAFVLGVRADAHAPQLVNFSVRQNYLYAEEADNANVHHWIQPGIVSRPRTRGNRIEVVSFKGHVQNLYEPFRSDAFRAALAENEIRLEIDCPSPGRQGHTWNDYSETDAVLAVRNLTHYDARHKPASKLVNAWKARCPAILSPEPAFRELCRSPLDYIEVHSIDEPLRVLRFLKAYPKIYERFLEHAEKRAQEFEDRKIFERWCEIMETKVRPEFLRWQSMSRAARFARISQMCAAEPLAKRWHHYRALNGKRILENDSARTLTHLDFVPPRYVPNRLRTA